MLRSDAEEIWKMVQEMARQGCDCDVMNGYMCGIHYLASEIKIKLGLSGGINA